MARRSGIFYVLSYKHSVKLNGDALASYVSRHSFRTQATKAAEKARKDYERAVQADQKERARLYAEWRIAQVNLQNEQLDQYMWGRN